MLRLLTAIVLCLSPSVLRADVLIVSSIGGGEYESMSEALAVAQDGDILLLRGNFPGFSLPADRSLTLVAKDGSGSVDVFGGIRIVGLQAGRVMTLVGVDGVGVTDSDDVLRGHGLVIQDCAGDVRLQKCSFDGADGDPDAYEVGFSSFEVTGHLAGWSGALVEDNAGGVAFNNCAFSGGGSPSVFSFPDPDCGCTYGEPGGDGLTVVGTDVALLSSGATGGYGGGADRVGGRGGAGASISGGQLVVAGGVLAGGKGGAATDYIGPVYGGDGGHGVQVGAGAVARLAQLSLSGGEGGYSLSGDTGTDGSPTGGPGAAIFGPGHFRGLGVNAPIADDGTLLLTVAGQPGDTVIILLGFETAFGFIPKFKNHLLVEPLLTLNVGTVPANGVFQFQAAMGAIPVEGLQAWIQGMVGIPGDIALTGHSAVVVVDGDLL